MHCMHGVKACIACMPHAARAQGGLTRRYGRLLQAARRMTESALPARLKLHTQGRKPLWKGGPGGNLAGEVGYAHGFMGARDLFWALSSLFFRVVYGWRFWSVLEPFLLPKRTKKSIKIPEKNVTFFPRVF